MARVLRRVAKRTSIMLDDDLVAKLRQKGAPDYRPPDAAQSAQASVRLASNPMEEPKSQTTLTQLLARYGDQLIEEELTRAR